MEERNLAAVVDGSNFRFRLEEATLVGMDNAVLRRIVEYLLGGLENYGTYYRKPLCAIRIQCNRKEQSCSAIYRRTLSRERSTPISLVDYPLSINEKAD